jgi:serine/threonine protein kinase
MNASATQTSALVGAVLSRRWRIVSPIGEGGMGLVFVAENVQDGRRAAVKLLRTELVVEATIRARFLEEAATCMRLHHANILRVFETGEAEDKSPYFVMELLEGVPLSAYTQRSERFPIPQAVSIIRGVLHGLAAAHAANIVHRDLKPENVFLARDASGAFVVKLLDFGIAKVMDVAGGQGSRTKTGMLLGTPAYMSPEQVRSAKDADPRSDLWSAGVLFYEMLCGKQAWPAPTEYARLTAILGSQPEPLAATDPALAMWQPFIDRALQKDRAMRFQSAAEMEAALSAMHGGPQSQVVSQVLSHGPPTPIAGAAPPQRVITNEQHVRTPAAFTPTASNVPAIAFAPPNPLEATTPSPGGTLSSRPVVPGGVRASVPPQVQIVPPPSGDLESRSFRGQNKRGVPAAAVAALVLLALIAGIVIGFAVGRM